MGMIKNYFSVALLICIVLLGCMRSGLHKTYTDWRVTGGGKENLHYSSIKQIDTSNIQNLEIAWIYHTENKDQSRFGAMECNPIIIDSVMFGVSPRLKLFAINARTGKELWTFNPADSIANKTWHRNSVNMNRGVAYWAEGEDKRIIYTVGPVAMEVNASTLPQGWAGIPPKSLLRPPLR